MTLSDEILDKTSRINTPNKDSSKRIELIDSVSNKFTESKFLEILKELTIKDIMPQGDIFYNSKIEAFYPGVDKLSQSDSKVLEGLMPIVQASPLTYFAISFDKKTDSFSLHRLSFDILPPPIWDNSSKDCIRLNYKNELETNIYSSRQLASVLLDNAHYPARSTNELVNQVSENIENNLKIISKSI